jgi:uncharacterized membrane protein YfcA
LLTILLVILSALAASLLAAVAGFGGSVILLPVLVWAVGVVDAVPILTLAQLIGNLSRVLINRHELHWTVIWRFALGAVPLAVIGGIIFAKTPAGLLVRLLGVFLILMVVYRHTPWGRHYQMKLGGFVPLGAASGLISALLGTVGPLAAPFFLAYGLLKGAYIGTEAMTAVILHITKLGVYGGYSLIGARTLLIGLAIGAVMIVGTLLGSRLLRRVPQHLFPYIIEVVLVVSGIIFLVRG